MKDERPKKLENLEKKNVFETPEGYFDSLETRISSRIDRGEDEKVVALTSSRPWKWVAAAAAIALLLLSILPWFQSEKPSVDDMLAEIPAEQCLAYLKHSDLELSEILTVEDLEGLVDEYEGVLLPENELGEEDTDLLYERYGVTDDKKLQTL